MLNNVWESRDQVRKVRLVNMWTSAPFRNCLHNEMRYDYAVIFGGTNLNPSESNLSKHSFPITKVWWRNHAILMFKLCTVGGTAKNFHQVWNGVNLQTPAKVNHNTLWLIGWDNKRGVFCLVVGKEPDVACSCQHLVSWNKILSTAKDFSGLERSFAAVASIKSIMLSTK